MESYKKGPALGKGTFGVVYSAVGSDGKRVVLKEVVLAGLSQKDVEKTCKEASLLSSLRHPHIIRYFCHGVADGILTIVMELAANGTLKAYLNGREELLAEKEVVSIFSQLVLAVEHVHSLGIVHRDICGGNVLLTRDNLVKLGDFGISRRLSSWSGSSSGGPAGHPANLAPELCHGGRHTASTDMWAAGCLLYELTSLGHPFAAPTIAGLLVAILDSPSPTIPCKYGHLLHELVATLLSRDPTARPTAKALLSHPLLASYIHTLPVLYLQTHDYLTDSDKELLTYFCPDIFQNS